MDNIIYKINYFSDKAVFKSMNDSNSGAILKKVVDQDKFYFLKIVSKDSIDINKIKKTIEIYEKCNVNTIQLLEYGSIEDKVYLIYTFIHGYALNTTYEKYTVVDYYNMGFEIGCNYRNINLNFKPEPIFYKNYNINELTNDFTDSFQRLYNGKLSYIKDIISEEKMEKIIEKMKELVSSFDEDKKVYIHADMHPKNIMMDNNNRLYIIDIESFCIDYFVMNMRWSIAAVFKNKENNEFFKGFINGYYDNKIPIEFNNQLVFILILNFIEHIIEFSQTKKKEFIICYTSQINMIFHSINLLDNQNILYNTSLF